MRVLRWMALGCVMLCGALPSSAQAQPQQSSTLNVTYTSLRAAPIAADFTQEFVIIGRFDLSVNACDRANCFVRMYATSQPALLRVKLGGAAPTNMSQCGVTVSANSNPNSHTFVVNWSSFPATFTVWLCYPLKWTTSPPATLSSPQFSFRLEQNNNPGS